MVESVALSEKSNSINILTTWYAETFEIVSIDHACEQNVL